MITSKIPGNKKMKTKSLKICLYQSKKKLNRKTFCEGYYNRLQSAIWKVIFFRKF